MLKTRVMPCLLLRNAALVKTVKFKTPGYVGDPINAVRIYNEKEVDELIFLDITATIEGRRPSFKILSEIASECFMPVAYGGGVTRLDDIEAIFNLGIEKVAMNTAAVETPALLSQAARTFGSQSIVASIDVRRTLWGRYEVYTRSGRQATGLDPATWARRMEAAGAGEIILTSIDRDGTMSGYDLDLIRTVTGAVTIPVIASGGAGSIADLAAAVRGGASAVAAGSMVVYYGPHRAVLINFPARIDLERALGETA